MYRPNVPWRATADGFLKINIDGAYSESHHTGGWGFCCPEHNLYYLKIEVGGRPSSLSPPSLYATWATIALCPR